MSSGQDSKFSNFLISNTLKSFGLIYWKQFVNVYIKGPICRSHSHPPGLNWKKCIFGYQMKAHIFLICLLQIQNFSFKFFVVTTKSVKLNGIPENNFLCIFITASSPGVHTFFCLWRVNKKLPQGETSQNEFQRSRSIN